MRNSLDCETRLNCLKRHSRKRNKLTSDSPKLQSVSTSKQRKPSRELAPKSEPVGKHERLDKLCPALSRVLKIAVRIRQVACDRKNCQEGSGRNGRSRTTRCDYSRT